jgi:hypothetical protein
MECQFFVGNVYCMNKCRCEIMLTAGAVRIMLKFGRAITGVPDERSHGDVLPLNDVRYSRLRLMII